jgi:indolepyruvate ferredoxin oxidoreductase
VNSLLKDVRIDDKYTVEDGRIFVTGIQALVRLPMLQHQRDLGAGHRTAGYITGYRGSPLGALDLQLQQAREYLDANQVVFAPAINEDLAATALWGAQQAQLDGEGRFDGVFGMWYGKGTPCATPTWPGRRRWAACWH